MLMTVIVKDTDHSHSFSHFNASAFMDHTENVS